MTPPPVKKIIVYNIQSLPYAEFEPAPPSQMTVIVGESDSGKTALTFRALCKLFFNSIPTRDIVRRGCKSASVSVVYDTPDNLTVSWRWRERGAGTGKTWWEVTRDGAKTVVLEGGGRQGNVPETIQGITGVRPITIGGAAWNLNFGRQLDGPFMGAAPPAERYRMLGALAGTLEVDAALKEVGTEIIRARRRETELGKEIEELEVVIGEYNWLESLGGDIQVTETALAEVGRKQLLRDKLAGLKGEVAAKKDMVSAAGGVILALKKAADRAGGIMSGVDVAADRRQRLAAAQINIVAPTGVLSMAEGVLAATETAHRISVALEAAAWKNTNLAAMKRLRRDIQGEKIKMSSSWRTLDATKTHQDAAEAIKLTTRMNHARSIFWGLLTGILRTKGDMSRYDEVLSLTAGMGRGKDLLSQVGTDVPRAKRLRKLAEEISPRIWGMDRAEEILSATRDIVQGWDILDRTDRFRKQRGKLMGLRGVIAETTANFNRTVEIALAEAGNLEVAAAEYRQLLLEAGICEECPVVDNVLAMTVDRLG